MAKIIPIILAITCYLCRTNIGYADISEPKYIVSIDAWDGQDWRIWQTLNVRLNGKSLGTPPIAFKKLEELTIEKGEHIRLELSARFGKENSGQVYSISNFIH